MLTLRQLGLLNTVWAVILPMWFSPFYIFLIRQFMIGLPNELIEAGEVDGAGTVRCYIHIVLPVCRPVIGAAVALSFADCWNLVEQPMTYLSQNAELQPLSVMFNQLVDQSTGIEFAGAAIYILPALFVYLYFLKDILTGIQLTELKIRGVKTNEPEKICAARACNSGGIWWRCVCSSPARLKPLLTAKVKITRGRSGRLEEKIQLTGKLTFPDVVKVAYPLTDGQTIQITKVNFRPGYTVNEGDAGHSGARCKL